LCINKKLLSLLQNSAFEWTSINLGVQFLEESKGFLDELDEKARDKIFKKLQDEI